MLLNDILRHRRLVMIIILCFIGLPMLVWVPGQVSVLDFFSSSASEPPVAKVGETPVSAGEFIAFYNRVQDQRSQMGQSASAAELVADGTVDRIVEQLVTVAMVTERTKAAPIQPDRKYLSERLQKDPNFQNEKGEFDAGAYNRWVEMNDKARTNWDAVFEEVAEGVNRDAYERLIGAAVRVPESELRRQFFDQNTKMKVKAAAVAPRIELSEEQIRAYYDAHLDEFMTPESRKADFITISLKAPEPPLVKELIDRAKAGEDFAELAKQHSQGIDAPEGGDLGWRTESPTLRAHEKPLFEMQPGEVRGPIESFLGLHIYKVEETRQSDAASREVKARQIVLRPELDAAERGVREERGKTLAAKAAGTDLAALAAAEGLQVQRTESFSNVSQTIAGVNDADVSSFLAGALRLEMGKVSELIAGPQGLYLAQVAEITPPSQKPYDEVKDEVKTAAVREAREKPEHRQRVNEFTAKVLEQAKSVEDMKAKFPELEVDVKESEQFGMSDMLFQQGILMDGRSLLSRIVNKKPGDFVGPIYDLMGAPNFVEVVERVAPEGETWDEQYKTEKEKLRADVIRGRRQQLQADYLSHLRTQYIKDALVQRDDDLIYQILGLDEQPAAPAASDEAATPAAEVETPSLETPAAETSAPEAAPVQESSPAPTEAPAPQTP